MKMVNKMKKILISIFIVLIIAIMVLSCQTKSVLVMDYNENNDNIYELDFTEEILSTKNFKLKVAPFTGYSYIIRKIYPKYNREIKEYFVYDFRDIDDGIENFKIDYINGLRKEYLYDEIEKVYKKGIVISKIEIYSNKEALNKFLKKYPKVKYKIISKEYESL